MKNAKKCAVNLFLYYNLTNIFNVDFEYHATIVLFGKFSMAGAQLIGEIGASKKLIKFFQSYTNQPNNAIDARGGGLGTFHL